MEPEAVDAVRFEHLVERARRRMTTDPAVARRDLEAALALWRGPAWEEVRCRDFAVAEAARVSDDRIAEISAAVIHAAADLTHALGGTVPARTVDPA